MAYNLYIIYYNMKILEKQDIRKFLSGFAGRDQLLNDLLNETLYGPLQRDKSALAEVLELDADQSPYLSKKYNQRSQPWYRFIPTPELRSSAMIITSWLMDEVGRIGYENINGPVSVALRGRLRAFKSLEHVLHIAQSKTPLFHQEELRAIMEQRDICREEKIKNIRHVCTFAGRHNLFQIITSSGMDNAGKLAENCLGNPKQPSPDFPHRKRVLHPDKWQYFSLRDPGGKSVITFMVDFANTNISYEGNKMRNVPKHAEKYIGMVCGYIYDRYPGLIPQTTQSGYYGMLTP